MEDVREQGISDNENECEQPGECIVDRNREEEEELEAEDSGVHADDLHCGRGRKRKEICPDEAEVKRVTANYQERQRMMKLNTALDQLRQYLPDQFKVGNRRISKIRTLRLAANYIKSLGDILKQDAIIRESLPPQPGFELRLPSLTEVNRQGDSGEMYTPEKELSLIPSPESLAHPTQDYRYHVYPGSSPPFPYNSHTPSSTLSHLTAFPQVAALQPYLPMYHPQFYPPGFHTLPQPPMGGPMISQML